MNTQTLDAMRTIEDMNLDTLLEMRDTWRTDAKRLYDLAGHAEQEIVRRMQEMGATVHVSENWEAKLMPPARTYSYNMERLSALVTLIREGEWQRLVATKLVYDVNKRELNLLEKRGGPIADIIREATITQEGLPKLQVKRLTEVG